MKHDKQLKPASMRVKEAAEALLYILMEQVSSQGGPLDITESIKSGIDIVRSKMIDATCFRHCVT